MRAIWLSVPDRFSRCVLRKVYIIGQPVFQSIPGSVHCDLYISAVRAESLENL